MYELDKSLNERIGDSQETRFEGSMEGMECSNFGTAREVLVD